MITLIKHRQIMGDDKPGFSIVDAKVTPGKVVAGAFGSKFDRVLHKGTKKPIKIKSILWQYAHKPPKEALEKRYILNKKTVFTEPKQIVKEIFS
jgi:hypothetical protein